MSFRFWIYQYKMYLLAGICLLFFIGLFAFSFVNSGFSVLSILGAQGDTFVVDEKTQAYVKTNPSFPELFDYLSVVADERGAVYALNTLIYGDLPQNIDTHLLGHFVTKKLYKEKGINGLEDCTSDLGYACAHAIVIESLFERGMVVFDEVNAICERVKGPGAYFMCFHGFGHGVLAYAGYELPDAIELCGKVGTEKYHRYESTECVGGALMEMRGGVHDPDLWEKNGKKYLDEKKPLDLCLSDFIKEEYRYICFVYSTAFIFDSLGAQDLPTFNEYGPAIRTCNVLTNPQYREACYGGFAKEFINFLFGRDVRKIEDITDEQLSEVISACNLAEVEDGVAACMKHSIIHLRKRGQYTFEIAGRFCELVSNQYANYCITNFVSILSEPNVLSAEQHEKFCTYVEGTFDRSCKH